MAQQTFNTNIQTRKASRWMSWMHRPKKRKFPSIPFLTLFYIAWKNLISKKLRTSLTFLGVAIGVGAIYFLISFGIGLRNLVTNEIIGNESIRSISVTSANSKIISLSTDSYNKIRDFSSTSEISASFTFPGSVQYSGSEIDSVVYGIDVPYQNMTSLNLVKGRLLQKDDEKAVLVNKAALKSMSIDEKTDITNSKIRIKIPLQQIRRDAKTIDDEFTVVGILDSGTGSEVFLPRYHFEVAQAGSYSQLKLLAKDDQSIAGLRKQIETLGFQTSSPIDTVEQINQVFRFFNYVLIGFGAIGMVIAILGMFNTLTISLIERTKEVGLLISLGGRRKDMRKLFVFEAVLLSSIGAVLGMFMARILSMVINELMNSFARGRGVVERFTLFSYPSWLFFMLSGFMIIISLIVVFLPARRAERINPIDALRRE